MISLVIPAYNEEWQIGKSLAEPFAFMNELRMKYEDVVVDGGSSDGTGRIVERIKDDLPKGRLVRL